MKKKLSESSAITFVEKYTEVVERWNEKERLNKECMLLLLKTIKEKIEEDLYG